MTTSIDDSVYIASPVDETPVAMHDLIDLVDDNGLHGCEVLEQGVKPEVLRALAQLAPQVRRDLAARARLLDCWSAVSAWQNALTKAGILHRVLFESDPDDQVTLDGHLVMQEERGGYETDGGVLKRHAWLALGEGLLLFDPTGHQFDGCGRPNLRRYWLQRRPSRIAFVDWREQPRERLGLKSNP